MLAFCKRNRNRVALVVVQDLSRFARNNGDQSQTIKELERNNISLYSIYDGPVEKTAVGKLKTNVVGSLNQFYSDSLSERQTERKRMAIEAGRMPWRAPLGYKNISSKSGANAIPDEERARFIREGFKLMATGLHKQIDVLEMLNREGFTTKQGKPVSSQAFSKILQHPVYAGWITGQVSLISNRSAVSTSLLLTKRHSIACRRSSAGRESR